MGRLTDRQIRNLSTNKTEQWVADGGGLYLRIRSDDTPKAWFYRYTLRGQAKKMHLGSYPTIRLADARETADRYRKDAKRGIDPMLERDKHRAALEAEAAKLSARITVNNLFDRWLTVDLSRHKDKGAEIKRMFDKDVLPKIGHLCVEDIKRGHITSVTDALLARGVKRMAKLIFSLIRQMLRFAVDRGVIEFDPSAAIRKANIGGKPVERDRVLSEDEVRALAKQLPNAGLKPETEAAVWIALSTCCRIGELTNARWEHIDFTNNTWRIPAENSKNGKQQIIHLSAFAVEQFAAIKATADDALAKKQKKDPKAKENPLVYPNREGDEPLCTKTITKQLGDRQLPENKKPMNRRVQSCKGQSLKLVGGKWTPHDLRRTGATMMVMLGVLPEVAERCLNHVEQNRVKRTYQRHSYEAEMQAAWALLGERVSILKATNPQKVVTMCRAA